MANDPLPDLDRMLDAATSAGGAGPCPDENVLAGLASGGLRERERAGALEHVVACAACREVVRALASHEAARRPAGRWLTLPRGLAAAAVLLLAIGAAVGAAYLLARPGSGGTEVASGGTAEALGVAMARLSREAPLEFGDVQPLGPAELIAPGSDVLRGLDVGATPSGRILDPRPTLRWSAVAGARTYRVTLLGPEGVRWERTTVDATLPWPDGAAPLAPGERAAWTVAADGPNATEITRAVAVAEDTESARWRRTEAAAVSVEEPLRWLVLAHAALRRDLPSSAVEHASRYLAAHPRDPLGVATRDAAVARLAPR